jgi:flagellar export protein FliJ
MSFTFPLESLLHFRESITRREEVKLQKANHQVNRVEDEIAKLEAHALANKNRRSRELRERLSGAELQFDQLCDSNLARCREARLKYLEQLKKLRDQQFEIYRKARADYEVLKSIRAEHFRLFQKLRARREQRQTDELFLLRRNHSIRG